MSVGVAGRLSGATPRMRGRRAWRLRSFAALLASVVFHAAIFALLFGSLKGGPVTGSGATGETNDEAHAITISLAGLRGAPRQATATPVDDMHALFAKIRSEQSTLAATVAPKPPTGNVAKLFDVVEPDARALDSANRGGGRADVEQGGHGASASAVDQSELVASPKGHGLHQVIGPDADASARKLWVQIEPCWSRLPHVSSVPVTLEITLNDQGRIAVPPKVLRDSADTPDQARLVAEARALTAASVCVPYRPAAAAGTIRSFEIRFAASMRHEGVAMGHMP